MSVIFVCFGHGSEFIFQVKWNCIDISIHGDEATTGLVVCPEVELDEADKLTAFCPSFGWSLKMLIMYA